MPDKNGKPFPHEHPCPFAIAASLISKAMIGAMPGRKDTDPPVEVPAPATCGAIVKHKGCALFVTYKGHTAEQIRGRCVFLSLNGIEYAARTAADSRPLAAGRPTTPPPPF